MHSRWKSLWPGVIVSLSGALIAAALHHAFGLSYDGVIFHQALSSVAHGGPPVTALKAEGVNIFGDHFHPLILLAVPALWVHDSLLSLMMVQAVMVGIAAGILHRTWLQELGRASAWPLVWMLSPAVAAALAFDFHDLTMASPFMALACRAWVRGRHGQCVLWSLVLLLAKEDASTLVTGMALALAMRGAKRIGAALAAIAVAWTLIVTRWVIPAFNSQGAYTYGSSPFQSLTAAMHNLIVPGWATLAWGALLLLVGWRAIASPLAMIPLAWVGSHLFIENCRYHVPFYHYHVLPFIALCFASIDARRRRAAATPAAGAHHTTPSRWGQRVAVVVAVIGLVASPAIIRLGLALHDQRPTAARAVIAQVPHGATVAADSALCARLSERTAHVTVAHPPRLVNGSDQPIRPEYVLLDMRARGGWAPVFVQTQLRGYEKILQQGDYALFRKTAH